MTLAPTTLPGRVLAHRRYRVAMRDVDSAGIIYFPSPLAWHEGMYTSWMAVIGHPLSALLRRGQATATVASEARYLRPLALDDVVELELSAARLGTTSFTLRTVACDSTDRPAVDVLTTHVWTVLRDPAGRPDETALRAENLPDWLRDALVGGQDLVEV
jgi:acyl-CoA thioesterase FadM